MQVLDRSAEHGEPVLRDAKRLHRRGFSAGLVGAAVFAGRSVSVLAQTAPVPGVDAPTVETESRLLTNLLTRMVTSTTLNGWSGYQFVIDTGAGRTAIAEDIAVALDLPAGPPVLVHGVTSAEVARTVRVGRLNFGGRRFHDIFAPVFPRPLLGADGLLGLDVLSRFELSFNMSRRTVRLVPSGSDVVTISQTFVTPSRLTREAGRGRRGRYGQLILINTLVAGIPVAAFVDSGAQYSIGNLALLRALIPTPERGVRRAPVQIFGVTGQTLMAEPGTVRQLEIGRQRMGPTPLLFADLHAFSALDLIERPSLLIGADVLYRFRHISLDFGRSRMSFRGLRPAAA